MKTLFFDTETTGLKHMKKPCTDPAQPMPVQIGLKLDAENRREMGALNYLVAPMEEGPVRWEINPKAEEIHGISEKMTKDFGVHVITAVDVFLDYVKAADVIVAHNANFDITVMRRATAVFCELSGFPYEDPFEDKKLICTMLASTNIVKATPKRNGQWKWPKLSECVRFFWNEDLEGAHDALVDVRACARVYYHLLDDGVFA